MPNENTKATDNVKTEQAASPTEPRFALVRVTAEGGIFKNGKLHKEGSEVVIALESAQRFESVGEVDILEEVEGK